MRKIATAIFGNLLHDSRLDLGASHSLVDARGELPTPTQLFKPASCQTDVFPPTSLLIHVETTRRLHVAAAE
jgi:hypothetical protein